MSRKYIRENKNSFSVVKNSKTYGKFKNLDDAIFIRDELVENDWDLSAIDKIHEIDGKYAVVSQIDEKIHILAEFDRKPSNETVEKLIKNKKRNPNNSRYGLNITKVFDTYVIKKRIAGDDYIFGYYDNLEDAEFVRNFLMDHNWNVNEFKQIEYDEETDTYRAVEVIDDRVYVLKTSNNNSDLNNAHEEFLTKIKKHSLGLSMHPHLDELSSKIPELEKRFNTKPKDDVWELGDTQNPLNDIIFNLTPFQKSVYDAINDSTFEEIKQSLIRFKSGNFDQKIQKNLDELINRGLVLKNGERYSINRMHD